MRPVVLVLGAAAAIGLVVAVVGSGNPAHTASDEAGRIEDGTAFATRVGLTGPAARGAAAAESADPGAMIAQVGIDRPPGDEPVAFSWSEPAEFAPVDPVR